MKPKITIITCTYYRPDLLRRAILSVKKSTLQDYEHLIISDHCPFASLVYNDFSDDERIKFLEVPDPYAYNLGAIPFNLGIKVAQADIVCYLLDDDLIYENHLEEHYSFYQNNPDAKCHQSRYNQANLHEPNNNVKFICSNSLEDLKKYNIDNAPWNDVGSMSHIKNIGKEWTPQTECGSNWEDNIFTASIGLPKPTGPLTSMKVQWDSHSRKDTKGLDEDYYNSLMSKLIEDEDTMSGYRVTSDSPYVYDDLTNSLYG
tara:strand:- start:892 stop:1668 length:777 start_codon:yes stop_codon:yes gene_type:complete